MLYLFVASLRCFCNLKLSKTPEQFVVIVESATCLLYPSYRVVQRYAALLKICYHFRGRIGVNEESFTVWQNSLHLSSALQLSFSLFA